MEIDWKLARRTFRVNIIDSMIVILDVIIVLYLRRQISNTKNMHPSGVIMSISYFQIAHTYMYTGERMPDRYMH